jgi:hypothetical protein
MISKRNEYAVTSTVPTENKIAMSIRPEDMGKIMGILTDLYKNKLLASIREYATNALDAIIDAGLDPTEHPVRVTLPTPLSPFLKIADSGVGLDEDGILTYSQYGHSTKDTRNDVVGMLGLGCKAALTYTAQFTLTSRHAGIERIAVISREADGSASVTPLSTEPTDEPNGTEVSIAIERNDHFRCEQLAAQFFSVWEEGTVLVNGKAPKRFDGLRITDDLYITQDGESKIVMGNVPYPVPELDDLCPAGSVLAYVPIGAVDFPPSRESLQDCKQTTEAIAKVRKDFADGVQVAIQREIDAADSPGEAVRVATRWDRYVPNGGRMNSRSTNMLSGYTYKGGPMPVFIEAETTREVCEYGDMKRTETIPFVTSAADSHKLGASREATRIYATEWNETVWVTGYTPGKFTAQHKRRIEKAIQDAGIEGARLYVCIYGPMPDQDGSKFIAAERILDWDEVRQIKLDPRPTRNSMSGRIPGSYDLYTEDGYKHGVPGDQIRQSSLILYIHGNRHTASRYTDAVAKERKKFTIVCLSENRIEKFKRNVPKAKTVRGFLTECRDKWAKSLSKDERDALWLADEYVTSDLKALDADEVDDPTLKRAVTIAHAVNVRALGERRDAYSRVVGRPVIESKMSNPLAAYPLFNTTSATSDHLHAYLNWHYAN